MCADHIQTHFSSSQLSRKRFGAMFPFVKAGAFRRFRFERRRWCLLLGNKGSPEVPNGELNLVVSVGECIITEREVPFAETHGENRKSRRLCLARPTT